MKKLVPLLLFWLLLTSFHPFHVGSLEVRHNAQTRRMELTARIFSDDLEDALNTDKTQKRLSFGIEAQKAQLQQVLQNYVRQHLQLKVNGKPVQLTYLGYEPDREATILYLESAVVPIPKKVEVSDDLLYNLFTDQSHLVHILVGGNRKSGKLSYPDRYIYQTF